MIPYLGDFAVGSTVYLVFNTFTSDDPSASCTITDLLNTDVKLYKNASATQRTSSNGITVYIDHDTVTGAHMISIDLSDNTDAGFYASGSDYFVKIEGTTIDGATVNAFVAHFSLQNRSAPSAGDVADAVWDEAKSGHTTTNTYGQIAADIGTDVSTYIKPMLVTMFHSLVGHGLHLFYGSASFFNRIYKDCYSSTDDLPSAHQSSARALLYFFKNTQAIRARKKK